ncbi:hypothetical protein K432DRAFT_376910 [Lepidopterella palustris CBS 459.81]|uniref:Uncharacterized protein n=1 Tax=Lepidopterella palustris CBS 459.81 TaxID=1314670 RepID=A0A8E2ELL4_9PEZI|nr:hypothetical protein K432DRAFT_376910 [Lepidopterella palustris CBS 459.81]
MATATAATRPRGRAGGNDGRAGTTAIKHENTTRGDTEAELERARKKTALTAARRAVEGHSHEGQNQAQAVARRADPPASKTETKGKEALGHSGSAPTRAAAEGAHDRESETKGGPAKSLRQLALSTLPLLQHAVAAIARLSAEQPTILLVVTLASLWMVYAMRLYILILVGGGVLVLAGLDAYKVKSNKEVLMKSMERGVGIREGSAQRRLPAPPRERGTGFMEEMVD